MSAWGVLRGSVALLSLLARPAICQVPVKDGRIDDPAIIQYLQSLQNTVATAVGAQPLEIRLTRSSDLYASRQPKRVLYISGALLERIDSEVELAGLLAHTLAHDTVQMAACVLASRRPPPDPGAARERERRATAIAIGYLKSAGYDPAGVLDLLSKLAYEHPAWAKAILPEDVLELRTRLEADAIPPAGYRIESSQFLRTHAILEAALGHTGAKKPSPSSEPALSRQH